MLFMGALALVLLGVSLVMRQPKVTTERRWRGMLVQNTQYGRLCGRADFAPCFWRFRLKWSRWGA